MNREGKQPRRWAVPRVLGGCVAYVSGPDPRLLLDEMGFEPTTSWFVVLIGNVEAGKYLSGFR